MNLIERPPLAIGRVELFTFDRQGREQVVECSSNLVQYEGFDALGKLLSGGASGFINAVYWRFHSSAGAVQTSAVNARTVRATTFHNLSTPYDYVRNRISGGVVSASDTNYESNRVTYTSVVPVDTVGENDGLPLDTSADIEMAALVVAPEWSDATQDYVYAAWAPGTVISPAATGGVGLRWQIQFAAS